MPTIRPVTLDCHDTAPEVVVRQQPYPLADDKPTEFWTTHVTLGSYPDTVQLVWTTDTPAEGIAIIDELVGTLTRASASIDQQARAVA